MTQESQTKELLASAGIQRTTPIHVRGHTAFNRPASGWIRFLARMVDLCCFLILFLATLRLIRITPVPNFRLFGILVVEFALVYGLAKRYLPKTPGQWAWGISGPHQQEHLTPSKIGAAIFLTVTTTTVFYAVAQVSLFDTPYFAQAQSLEFQASLPRTADAQVDTKWIVVPFFYTLGAWPKTYHGRPVLYSLPYEKGPPTRFVGHITARWLMPNVKVTFEGPKTPFEMPVEREDVRKCMQSSPSLLVFRHWKCWNIRKLALRRHIDEMENIHPSHWSLQWLQVTNGMLPPEEQVQGIYLSAWGPYRGQDRVILITADGKHQSIIFEYPKNDLGEQAHEVFTQALQSLRISDELNPGKAWIDRQLATIRLENLRKEKNTLELGQKLAEIQTLLLSKISVDPKTYDAFFHLGGTSLMLVRQAAHEKSQEDWLAAAKPMIQSAFKYAQDIAPADPKTTQLQNMWIDAKQY